MISKVTDSSCFKNHFYSFFLLCPSFAEFDQILNFFFFLYQTMLSLTIATDDSPKSTFHSIDIVLDSTARK